LSVCKSVEPIIFWIVYFFLCSPVVFSKAIFSGSILAQKFVWHFTGKLPFFVYIFS
jgi:hypothetical protein